MKIENSFSIEIKRDGAYLRGFAIVDGVRQLIDIVPQKVEHAELFRFFENHVMPAMETRKQGRVAFKKGKILKN